eukprot:6963372-Prymnesium_polylepis.1
MWVTIGRVARGCPACVRAAAWWLSAPMATGALPGRRRCAHRRRTMAAFTCTTAAAARPPAGAHTARRVPLRGARTTVWTSRGSRASRVLA